MIQIIDLDSNFSKIIDSENFITNLVISPKNDILVVTT